MAKLQFERRRLEIQSENVGIEVKEKVLRDSIAEEEEKLKQELGLNTTSIETQVIREQQRSSKEAGNLGTDSVGISASANIQVAASDMKNFIEALLMPEVKLKEYDGNPLEYWTFIRFFEVCEQNLCRHP